MDSFKSPHSVLRPRSIAIVGASERAHWPGMIYALLRENGFDGKIYPINPKYREVWGVACHPSFAALPEAVEHAAVIVPAEAVLPTLEEATKCGLKSATVYAANIGEGRNAEAIARGIALKALCDKTGLAVSGPNCMGSNSWREKVFLYPNRGLAQIPTGGVAAIFQSGGTIQIWLKVASERGLRFSYGISSGNELDLDLADYLNFVVDDPETKVVVLYIEGIRRPEAFMAAASRAKAAGKPILALKSGRSARSREAALSHTGAIAGDIAGYEAMCERYAIINCSSFDEMLENALVFQAGRLPKGRRIGVVTTSGALTGLLHDEAEKQGAVFPSFSPSTITALKPFLQEGIAPGNPLDAGIPGESGLEGVAKLCGAVLADSKIDMVAWSAFLPGRKSAWKDVSPMRELLAKTDKPFIGSARMHHDLGREGLEMQEALGVPFVQGNEATLRALNALAFYSTRKDRPIRRLPVPKGKATATGDDATLRKALARYGIASPSSQFALTPTAAASAARKIGFPVALKIVSSGVSHKTEVGGVKLNLRSAAEVVKAGKELSALFRRRAPKKASLGGFLVQEMVSGVEAIIGARTDRQYGPLILAGSGGTHVELERDIAIRLLPLTTVEAREMIANLKLMQLLAGFRGAPRADAGALIRAIVGLARFYLDHRPYLADLEINPLIVRPGHRGVCAVDIRFTRMDATDHA